MTDFKESTFATKENMKYKTFGLLVSPKIFHKKNSCKQDSTKVSFKIPFKLLFHHISNEITVSSNFSTRSHQC